MKNAAPASASAFIHMEWFILRIVNSDHEMPLVVLIIVIVRIDDAVEVGSL